MRELVLVLFLLAAAQAPGARAEEGCRDTGRPDGEVAVCGDTSELDAAALSHPAGAGGATAPIPRRIEPAESFATGSRPMTRGDRDDVPKGRQY